MHTAHFRHLFDLYRQQASLRAGIFAGFLLTLMMVCPDSALAQRFTAKGNYNFMEFQKKPYYFGITLGANASRFRPYRSSGFIEHDSLYSIESLNGPGFNLGIVTNFKVGQFFDFRLLPTLSFAERKLQYRAGQTSTIPQEIRVESVFVEIPFHVRYKSAPFHDLRLFVIGGIKYAFDVASNSRAREADQLLKIAPSDFSVEYGAGVQIFFPFFIFSPEFKVSHGIGNTHIYNTSLEESSVLEKLLSRTFTISLHFEG